MTSAMLLASIIVLSHPALSKAPGFNTGGHLGGRLSAGAASHLVQLINSRREAQTKLTVACSFAFCGKDKNVEIPTVLFRAVSSVLRRPQNDCQISGVELWLVHTLGCSMTHPVLYYDYTTGPESLSRMQDPGRLGRKELV